MRSQLKEVKFKITPDELRWVGNGFNVYNLLRPSQELASSISPFLLMDYAPPKKFAPTQNKKGVGEHPHRGFETVTLALQGSVEHRDSSGGGGVIGPGDIQWMTAGSGVVHDEFHSNEFSKTGGIFEMVQLWVNLPREHKMTAPKYQSIKNNDVPKLRLSEETSLNVVAGEYENELGVCSTYSPINVYTIDIDSRDEFALELSEGTNTIVLNLEGDISINDTKLSSSELLIFEREGKKLDIKSNSKAKVLVLNGEPIDEPIVAHGPFVMNTEDEIYKAILDYQSGNMGKL
jgi:redox-sensitive bicupin YhaK (pirin superfamily)